MSRFATGVVGEGETRFWLGETMLGLGETRFGLGETRLGLSETRFCLGLIFGMGGMLLLTVVSVRDPWVLSDEEGKVVTVNVKAGCVVRIVGNCPVLLTPPAMMVGEPFT